VEYWSCDQGQMRWEDANRIVGSWLHSWSRRPLARAEASPDTTDRHRGGGHVGDWIAFAGISPSWLLLKEVPL
jgi:hypothetical protein